MVLTGPIVSMQCRVRPSTRERAGTSADALGITMGRYVEWLVWRDQQDENGRPTWADEVDLSVEPVPASLVEDSAA